MRTTCSHSPAGEILAQSLSQLERDIHPVVIISAYNKALKASLEIINKISIPINTTSDDEMLSLIKTSIGTKFVARWSDLMCRLALQAVRTVAAEENGHKTVDIKRYARVEKIPGGSIEESRVLDGVLLNKDITHPNMRRRIQQPRILLLDCPLEYKKGESQTNMEFSKESDWARAQEIEEEQVIAQCKRILEFKPDLVITEKGVSGGSALAISRPASLTRGIDTAQHVFERANVSAIRRVRKSDNNRIALAVGATIVNRVEDLRESDVGTGCGLFHIEKIGDEYVSLSAIVQDLPSPTDTSPS